MFIPAPTGTKKVAVSYLLHAQEVLNIMHFVQSEGTEQDLADLVLGVWTTDVLTHLSEDILLHQVVVTDVETEGGATAGSDIVDRTGGVNSTALANEVALVATLRTGVAGRSGRGRIYVPGIPSNAIVSGDGNHVNGTYASDLQGGINSAISAIGTDATASSALVVTSYFHDKAARATAVNNAVTSITVNTRVDSQRRRMPRS